MTADDHVVATRAVYDASADRYVDFVGTALSHKTEDPVDLGLLSGFLALADPKAGPVVDAGCGPGRVAAFARARGLDPIGVDLAPAMVAAARQAHPDLRFEEGRLDELPLPDGRAGALVAWYSVIYTPPRGLQVVFGEFHRVLAPGGPVLVAFQAGDGRSVPSSSAHGTGLALTRYLHSIPEVSRRLVAAGFQLHAVLERQPVLPHETDPQAFVAARRPSA